MNLSSARSVPGLEINYNFPPPPPPTFGSVLEGKTLKMLFFLAVAFALSLFIIRAI